MAIFLLYSISQLSSNFKVMGPIFRVTQEILKISFSPTPATHNTPQPWHRPMHRQDVMARAPLALVLPQDLTSKHQNIMPLPWMGSQSLQEGLLPWQRGANIKRQGCLTTSTDPTIVLCHSLGCTSWKLCLFFVPVNQDFLQGETWWSHHRQSLYEED